MGLSRALVGLSRDMVGLSRAFVGLSRVMVGLSRAFVGFSRAMVRGVISNFSRGPNFFLFFNATGLLKNWKKQHFICSNLTLFIVLSFFLFSPLFLFLSFFLSFFLFPWEGDGLPASLK